MFSYYAPRSWNTDRGWRTFRESSVVKLSPGESQVTQWKSVFSTTQDHHAFLPGLDNRAGHRAITAGVEGYRPSYELLSCDRMANDIPRLEHIRSLPTKVKVLRYLEHVEKSRKNGNGFGAPGSMSSTQSNVNTASGGADEWNPFKSVDIGYVISYPEDVMEQSASFVGSSTVDEDVMMGECVYGAVGDHLCRYSGSLESRNVFIRSPASGGDISLNENSMVGDYTMRMLWSSYESWYEYAPLNADICWMWSCKDQ